MMYSLPPQEDFAEEIINRPTGRGWGAGAIKSTIEIEASWDLPSKHPTSRADLYAFYLKKLVSRLRLW